MLSRRLLCPYLEIDVCRCKALNPSPLRERGFFLIGFTLTSRRSKQVDNQTKSVLCLDLREVIVTPDRAPSTPPGFDPSPPTFPGCW
jgi:hypothetical protein